MAGHVQNPKHQGSHPLAGAKIRNPLTKPTLTLGHQVPPLIGPVQNLCSIQRPESEFAVDLALYLSLNITHCASCTPQIDLAIQNLFAQVSGAYPRSLGHDRNLLGRCTLLICGPNPHLFLLSPDIYIMKLLFKMSYCTFPDTAGPYHLCQIFFLAVKS
jgi:hypothetical protein